MKEVRITQQELTDAPDAIFGFHLVLGRLLTEKGIRFRHHTTLASEPPELIPPYEMWRDPCTLDLVIRQ